MIDLWKADKKNYVKKSTFSAYVLLIENHLLPTFGDKYEVPETDVQQFVLQKLASGLSQKTIKDILIVLKMVLKFSAKKNGLLMNLLKSNIQPFVKAKILRFCLEPSKENNELHQ